MGDIKGFFDNVDHYILAELIQRRVADQRFIDLYWKLVKAGFVKGVDTNTHGVPSSLVQGSLVQGSLQGSLSPILSNIYLNELDRYMEDYIDKHKTLISKNPKINFSKITAHKYSETTQPDSSIFLKELKAQRAQRNQLRSRVRSGVRIHYVRYADE